MTVHIREFVMRLGVDGEGASKPADSDSNVRVEDLETLREDLLRELRSSIADVRAQPFDR